LNALVFFGSRFTLAIRARIADVCAHDCRPRPSAQLLTYLKLSGKKVGLLMNFNVLRLKDGIKRMVNQL
jgi:hypothetical protein